MPRRGVARQNHDIRFHKQWREGRKLKVQVIEDVEYHG